MFKLGDKVRIKEYGWVGLITSQEFGLHGVRTGKIIYYTSSLGLEKA